MLLNPSLNEMFYRQKVKPRWCGVCCLPASSRHTPSKTRYARMMPRPLQRVDPLELARQVPREVFRVWSLAGNALHQVFGYINRADCVHLLAQPVQHKGCIALREALIEIRECLAQSCVNLRAVEITERVGREVAEAACPVNILQNPLRIALWLDSQVFTVLRVPLAWQALNGDIPVNQLLLQLVAHDDMQVVGHLVGLDADQARLYPV